MTRELITKIIFDAIRELETIRGLWLIDQATIIQSNEYTVNIDAYGLLKESLKTTFAIKELEIDSIRHSSSFFITIDMDKLVTTIQNTTIKQYT